MSEYQKNTEVMESYPNNDALKELLLEEGVIDSGVIVMPEDYEATVRRAKILMREDSSLSEETAIALGYADRMSAITHSMLGVIENMDQGVILSMIREAGHREATLEEVQMLIKFLKERPDAILSESIVAWAKARSAAQSEVQGVNALVDGDETVLTVSNDPADLRRIVEEKRDFQ